MAYSRYRARNQTNKQTVVNCRHLYPLPKAKAAAISGDNRTPKLFVSSVKECPIKKVGETRPKRTITEVSLLL